MRSDSPSSAAGARPQPDPSERPLRERIEEEIAAGRAAPQVMPHIAARVQEVTRKERYALRELTAVIESEPSLAARVLRYANSAAYAGLREVTDLHQAVTRLGSNMVESIALAAATRELYQASDPAEKRTMEALWRHSVAAAEVGRLVAGNVATARPEEVFLTCLLHDVGWVVILRALSFIEAECGAPVGEGVRRELLETLHPEFGARLLEAWRVPGLIAEGVRHHHEPERAAEENQLAHVVCLGDAICDKLGYGAEPDPGISLLALPSTSALKFDDLSLAALMVDVEDALAGSASLAWAGGEPG